MPRVLHMAREHAREFAETHQFMPRSEGRNMICKVTATVGDLNVIKIKSGGMAMVLEVVVLQS